MSSLRLLVAALFLAVPLGCGNNPYPDADDTRKIQYAPYATAPKTLDPAVAYSVVDHQVTGPIYETLLEYHFLKRPYELIPGIAVAIPEAEPQADGRVKYRFELRDGLLFQDDPCFELSGSGRTRQVLASDVAFELMRIADPGVNSPVIKTFAKIVGLKEFGDRLKERRESDPEFAALRIDEQYAAAGPVEGLQMPTPLELEITLGEPYPQILYWFAMEFTTPVPWEAVAYYDGEDGRDLFAEHPVGAGPYKIVEYAKRFRIALEVNPNWYGIRHPEWQAPAAVYPSEGEPHDAAAGRLDPAYVGKPLPFIERLELRLDKEPLPTFGKFLQGYYDASGIIEESFDQVVHEGGLSPDMAARGVALEKNVDPDVFYLGFNMLDDLVGKEAGAAGRKLRQAMSLVIDTEEFTEIFTNGRGIPAQSPIPPGIYGHDPDYRNPYRQVDVPRARALLAEAGFADGIDPETGRPLKLTFDTPDTSARGRLRYQYFVDAWNELGLDVEIAATNYNQFREKVRTGSYQIFLWGWVADYPDPENFLFLLWGPMGQTASGGPNTANFQNDRYDELFLEMRARGNDARRLELIHEMREIIETERPWIEFYHRESYALYQPWVRNVKPLGMSFSVLKYRDIDAAQRAELRAAWNEPLLWPAYALAVAAIVLVIPGIVTFFRERQ